ncbi:hypothetical protein Cantr_09698 [Candida viswanathii]|uniref:Uncharacterized protein n=1 Tax=Candida viswanathii TaxID=5486 RepID=A0A367YCQ6_9ASCO|nr:hypothetical protein Cantr_09698 [Candida viswanathii]
MVIGYFVSKVPFSNHMPIIRRFHPNHNNNNNQQQQKVLDSSMGTSSGSEDSFDEYSETSDSSAAKHIPRRRRRGNRNHEEEVILDDGSIFDAPMKKRNHLSSVDNSAMVKVSQRLARRKAQRVRFEDEVSSSPVKSKLGRLMDDEDSDVEDNRSQTYLNNQNDKFDELITKNIDVVLNPDLNKTANERIIKMVYDNRRSIASSVYQIGKDQLSSRLPYIPYFNPKKNQQKKEVESGSGSTTPTLLGSPFTDYCLQVAEIDEINEPYIEEPVSESEEDALMNDLNSEDEVDIFIESLDDKTKVMLYELLKNDLGDHHHQNNRSGTFREVYYNKNVSALDKLQMFLIIWVKLWIASIKLFIPVTRYLIYKFQNNHLFLFNMKNIERLVDLILRFMNYLDSFINNHECTIDKMSQQDYVQAEQVYLDFTTYTSGLFNQTTFKEILFSPDVTKSKIYELALNTR